ncbi:MAG: DNA adenine methylase [Ruminococcus sp.]|nr:DNA adenine methylase [Ruminococcus sp.]
MKNYGMPYKGSKNQIAEKIISVLPDAEYFVDLFGGGGAISHCAALSGKYKKVIYNEIEPLVYKGFVMALNGEFANEKRWISREDFFRLKDTDPYVAMCFSFGNDLKTYAYSKENERLKEHLHKIFFAETPEKSYFQWKKLLNDYEKNNSDCSKTFKILQNLDSLRRLQALENLERLERLKNIDSGNITCFNLSYEQVEIPENSVIYCDIPYRNTNSYISGFDHKKFYEWALNQKNQVFVSEYSMPETFREIADFEKRCKFSGTKSLKTVEKIFVNRVDL